MAELLPRGTIIPREDPRVGILLREFPDLLYRKPDGWVTVRPESEFIDGLTGRSNALKPSATLADIDGELAMLEQRRKGLHWQIDRIEAMWRRKIELGIGTVDDAEALAQSEANYHQGKP